jgi:hypothetical protein
MKVSSIIAKHGEGLKSYDFSYDNNTVEDYPAPSYLIILRDLILNSGSTLDIPDMILIILGCHLHLVIALF